MPKKILDKWQIEYLQLLDEEGQVDTQNAPHLTETELVQMYKDMVLARQFDAKLLLLQRQGKIATFAQAKGQEAAQVASAHALAQQDWIVPSFREMPAAIVRGLPLENVLLYNGGREEGSVAPAGVNIFPTSIPVGTHMLHAVGFAIGKQRQGQNVVVATYFGDGATSEGDFHEACNLAAVYKAPVIFICQNNQYAISTPVAQQTAAPTLAQKAIAYNMPTIRVDGNDILAVYKATAEATERARKGNGPSFIECLTYRLADHTTADDWRKYRSEEEVKQWEKKDPIKRTRLFLEKNKLWDQKKEDTWQKQVDGKIQEALTIAEHIPRARPQDLFAFTFQEQPSELQEQQEECTKELEHSKEDEIWYL